MFFVILLVGICMVVAQGVASYRDGWFSQSQMQSHGVNGYAFVEHGGMWADIFVISPAIALIMSKYNLLYFSLLGLHILCVIVVFNIWFLYLYSQAGKTAPEAHTHYGETTIAGWLHGFYTVVAMWVFVLFLVTPTTPKVTTGDLITVATFLTILFPLGIIKFNSKWKWLMSNTRQVLIETVLVWSVVIFKILVK